MTMISTETPASRQTVCLFRSITSDVLAGLTGLAAFLLDRGYEDLRQRGRILDYAAREGTLEGCADLDPHHHATAEAAFVGGMTEVPATDPRWGAAPGAEWFGRKEDDVWTPSDATLRLDVAELLAADVADFESWLDSLDGSHIDAVA